MRSAQPGALPLILTHGWPGSVVEYLDLIGPLTDPRGHGAGTGPAFDVVIPSLSAFNTLHNRQPQTIAHALADSPGQFRLDRDAVAPEAIARWIVDGE